MSGKNTFSKAPFMFLGNLDVAKLTWRDSDCTLRSAKHHLCQIFSSLNSKRSGQDYYYAINNSNICPLEYGKGEGSGLHSLAKFRTGQSEISRNFGLIKQSSASKHANKVSK